jgi:hypothetical protein
MKRPMINVKVIDQDGTVLHHAVRYAWNSALRETEAGVREVARTRGEMFTRGESSAVKADRNRATAGDAYGCIWTGVRSGHQVMASVTVS